MATRGQDPSGQDARSTLLIVDDQLLYREALCEVVGHWPEFQLVGDVANGQEAIDFCRELVPDLVLLDVQMPGMDGVEAAGIIHGLHPQVKIVMLTVTAEDKYLFGAIRNGACGYILKDTPARQLRNRLQGVMCGEGALSGVAAKKAINRLSAQEPVSDRPPLLSAAGAHLTDREKELMKLVAEGLSNEEIGHRLYLSGATVKKQLSFLMQKLGLENRVQLAVYVVRAGLAD